jgi:2-keto-4-pentenoate hydratase/2-oxohepta-3-ene-1,7-dioic acid hydratase in catechol pathway
LVSYVKSRFPVLPGDVILTGTPHGVSQVRAGDLMEARVISEGGQVISQGSWRAVQGKEE